MSNANKDATFSLKVMINREKNKVLFAEADNHFIDILLSFLTLPLGRIIKVLEKHYGDKAPTIGSLNSLFHSLANLDTVHFVTEAAKQSLLNPPSSFEAEYERLKLDIADYHPAEYFKCAFNSETTFRSVSIYYDNDVTCNSWKCRKAMKLEVAEKGSVAASASASGNGVFTINTASFVISDDLQIFPSLMGVFSIINIIGLGITDVDKADVIQVTFGIDEILSLLRASLISPTPLSDVILNTKGAVVESEANMLIDQMENEKNSELKRDLKVAVQISSGKVLYAEAGHDFVDFLVSLLFIPLGGVDHLLGVEVACFKAINNLHRSTANFIDDKYFEGDSIKGELMIPEVVHGCVSDNHILRLTQKELPYPYTDNNLRMFCLSDKFPEGQGRYLKGPTTYLLMNDLTVTRYEICSIVSCLKKQNIPLSDVKEVQLPIGLKEAKSILKASLTSANSALSDVLLNHIEIKPKREEV